MKTLLTILTLLLSSFASAAVSTDSNGWTVITPSADSRIVYVSNSDGNDSNNGLSPATPKKTITAGNALIREGFPDHLLLKRGDVFPVESSNILGRWKNGRNAQEPIVLSCYGTSGERPVIKVSNVLIDHNSQARNYQALIGIDIYKSNSDPASPDFTDASCSTALRFVGGGANLLIEDCRLRFMMTTVQSHDGNNYSHLRFRRNIVTDAWVHGSSASHSGRIQGLYLQGIKQSCVLEENLFDHCGWSSTISGAGANMYNHNVYILQNSDAGAVIRGNIFSRGSAHGLQARSGGLIDRNIFVLNSVAVNVGYHVTAPSDPNVYTFPNRAKENVILNGRRQNLESSPAASTAVWGIWCHANLPGVLVEDNIVANRSESGSNVAYHEIATATMVNNISYAWGGGLDTTNPAWPHPDHDLGDYYSSIGGSNDTFAYLNWLRSRPLRTMPWDMTAYSAINYIRAGFNKSPVSGYYEYSGIQAVAVTGISVSSAQLSIQKNRTQQLTAIIHPDNATNRSVSWTSSNSNTATISSGGFISTLQEGTTTLTATTEDGGFTATITLTVTASSQTENLLAFGDFSGNALRDMPNSYIFGTQDTNVWFARSGTCGQCSSIATESSDPFLKSGRGTTNGTFQVIAWPGNGFLDVDFEYRGQTRVRISGADASDQLGKFDNASTTHEISTLLTPSGTEWTSGYLGATLDTEYDYIVIQFIDGEVDNVSAQLDTPDSDPDPDPEVTWNGLPVYDGWVRAEENHSGWLYINHAPWLFWDNLQTWIFAPQHESWVSDSQWLYIPKL